jgi:uncharacterized protein YndB with AHSA1/START domain
LWVVEQASPDPGRCSVRLTRRYDASPAEVWGALTEPDSMARWLAHPRSVELSPGGSLELELRNSGVIAAVVREVEPGRVLELDWRYESEDPSIVRFELAADGDGTMLVLDHRRIDERFGMLYISRWEQAIARFETVVSG